MSSWMLRLYDKVLTGHQIATPCFTATSPWNCAYTRPCYNLTCTLTFPLAEKGNTIIVEHGSAIVTQQLKSGVFNDSELIPDIIFPTGNYRMGR